MSTLMQSSSKTRGTSSIASSRRWLSLLTPSSRGEAVAPWKYVRHLVEANRLIDETEWRIAKQRERTEDDFVAKHAAGRGRETEEAFAKIYQEVVEDLVKTIREKWVHGLASDTKEMLLGEAAIKGIWLAREFTRSGVGRHIQSTRLSKARMAFEKAIEVVAAHAGRSERSGKRNA